MKKVIVAIIILSLILAAGILEAVEIDKIFGELGTKLDGIYDMILASSPDTNQAVDETTAWWEKKREHIELFAYSPDLRSFSIALAEMKGSIEKGDFDNALSKCESLRLAFFDV